MSLKDIALAARKRWVVVVALSALGAILGLGVGLLTTAQYEARTYVYVAGQPTDDGTGAYEGSLLAEQKARAYSEIVSSGSFAGKVAGAVGGDPLTVAEQVSVSTQADSSLIAVIATDPSPQRAAGLADAGAGAVVQLVGDLERPPPGRPATVTALVVEPATVPTEPVGIGLATYIVFGFALGLLAGLVTAAVRSTVDTTVGDSRELGTLLDAPVLGVVPRDHQGGGNLMASTDQHTPLAEAFRQVRTSLGFVALSGEVTTVMVTSAVEREGKSTVVADLAIVLAQQGQRVVVVDADLRRPRLSALFGLPEDVGLTNVLLGRLSLEQALQSGDGGRVAVLGRGLEPPNPADLLTHPALGTLLERLAERYDVVLLDTPPVLALADAAILSRRCDGVILVVRAGRTASRVVLEASERLRAASARHLGSVLTMARVDVNRYRGYRPTVPTPLRGFSFSRRTGPAGSAHPGQPVEDPPEPLVEEAESKRSEASEPVTTPKSVTSTRESS